MESTTNKDTTLRLPWSIRDGNAPNGTPEPKLVDDNGTCPFHYTWFTAQELPALEAVVRAVNAYDTHVKALQSCLINHRSQLRTFRKHDMEPSENMLWHEQMLVSVLAGTPPAQSQGARADILVQAIQATINSLQALLDHPEPHVVIHDWVGGTLSKLETIVETDAALTGATGGEA